MCIMRSRCCLHVLLFQVLVLCDCRPSPVPSSHWQSSERLVRRRRDWVIPPISFPENDRGPFPKAVVQVRQPSPTSHQKPCKNQQGVSFQIHSSNAREVTILYKITGPGADLPPEGVFTIARRTGVLYVNEPLDRERTQQYKLTAHAYVAGTEEERPAEAPMEVVIKVVDQNDNRPTCSKDPFVGDVSETAVLDHPVTRVSALDDDDPATENAVVRYSIVRQDPQLPNAEMFSINAVSGVVSVASVGLDRETHGRYKLIIKAADLEGRGMSTSCTAVITVTDSNDHAPKFSHQTYTGSVEENVVGAVVARLPVTDLDQPFTAQSATVYSIVTGDQRGVFNISTGPSGMEGIITTAQALDFEQERRFTLLVAVKNRLPFAVPLRTSTATVSVIVEDVNEPPVLMPEERQLTVPEDLQVGSVITQFRAKDPDTDRHQAVRYRLLEDPAGWLEVGRDTGLVMLRKTMLRGSAYIRDGKYRAIVLAHDDDVVPATATGTLLIHVRDVNDHAPQLEEQIVQFCVLDPVPIPLTITDGDGPGNAGPFTVELQDDARVNWTVSTNPAGAVLLKPRRFVVPGEYPLALRVYDAGMLYWDGPLLAEVCQCSGSALTCTRPVPSPRQSHAPLAYAAIVLALVILLVPLLLLLFLRRTRGHKPTAPLVKEVLRGHLMDYREEGGGEDDQVYDLSQLQKAMHDPEIWCYEVLPRKLGPKQTQAISRFIHQNLCVVEGDPIAWPFDTVRVFEYEGQGSSCGSLSSLQSSSLGEDQDQDQDQVSQLLAHWGPAFRKLADMYTDGRDTRAEHPSSQSQTSTDNLCSYLIRLEKTIHVEL
ncbi:B-cadherin-like isoform X2 [Denticeps clupeoides]|uniref:B-cadherin-like isoform X2 n=1 Tax=Denticeps clupeoides TaxID=299321 RepID=UPI0010A382C6|nr:B-cadherin-like isoform X2 [Denticeps clupeoides]